MTSPVPRPRRLANPCGAAWTTTRVVGSARNCAKTATRSVPAPRRSRMTPRASRATRGRTLSAGRPPSTTSPTRWTPSASRVGPQSACTPSTPPGPSSIVSSRWRRRRSALATSRSSPAVSRGHSAPDPRSHRLKPRRKARETPRAPPTRWAPTFLSRTEITRRGKRGRRRRRIDAFAETPANRPSCASGCLSPTPRWTPGVYTCSPEARIEPGTIRTTRTTSDPPRESREEAPRFDSPSPTFARFPPRRVRSARGRDRPCTGADRVASARTTTRTRAKTRPRRDSSRFDTREDYPTPSRGGFRVARDPVEVWRARFGKRRRGSSRAEGRCR